MKKPSEHFDVVASADAQSLSRVLDQLARLAILPEKLDAEVRGDTIYIHFKTAEIGRHRADLIVEKLRSCVLVISADVRN